MAPEWARWGIGKRLWHGSGIPLTKTKGQAVKPPEAQIDL
jgi:hypothetical protein